MHAVFERHGARCAAATNRWAAHAGLQPGRPRALASRRVGAGIAHHLRQLARPTITCGKTPVITYRDVLYDMPTSGGKPVPLKLDVQVPKGAGKKPLVVFTTGGGFVLAQKSANLN